MKKINPELLNILICPQCNKKFTLKGQKLECIKGHTFSQKNGVPVFAQLNEYLQTEAHAWEDDWQKGVSKDALEAYKINMKVFDKLGFWDESGKAAKFIPSRNDSVVLDLACGNGVSTANIKGKIVVGLDLSSEQLAKAKIKYPDKSYVVADARKLPFADNTFDLIVGINMLHHVLDPEKVLKECYRALKRNGKLLTVDPNLYNPIGFVGRGLFRLLKLKKYFPSFPQFALGEDEYQFTKSKYYELFKASPFRDFKIIPHRVERILFFGTILIPALVKMPLYENILFGVSRVGNAIVKIRPFDYICYFWKCEARKS